MATSQAIDPSADRIGAKDLLKEAVERCCEDPKKSSKFLRYASLAYYYEAELNNLGVIVTQSSVAAMRSAEMYAMTAEDYYQHEFDGADKALEKIRKDKNDIVAGRLYLERKTSHALRNWIDDVVNIAGESRNVLIEEMCHYTTKFVDSASLAMKIAQMELGEDSYMIVEVFKHAIKYAEYHFYRAIGNLSDSYIHTTDPKAELKLCKENNTIPEPLIKKMMAEEAIITEGASDWVTNG